MEYYRRDSFAGQFTESVGIWKDHLSSLVLVTLIFLLVAWIPIVNIAFISGYLRSLIKTSREQGPPRISDIFGAWDCFASLFVYLLICLIISVALHFVPIAGTLASLTLGFLAAPGAFAIIDRNLGTIEAFKWGISSIEGAFVPWLLAYLAGTMISCAGFMMLVIGGLLTLPLGQMIIIQQYEQARRS